MAFTTEQQARLDAAQKRLDTAKSAWIYNRDRYNDFMNNGSGMGCYHGTVETPEAAATWFNPTDAPCDATGKDKNTGDNCNLNKKENCKDTIKYINTNVIPALRSAYNELNAAQVNFDKVLKEIEQEVKNDPELIAELEQIQQDAEQAGMTTRTKIIWISIIVIVVAVLGFILIRRFSK